MALLYAGLVDQSSSNQQRLVFGAFCIGDVVFGSIVLMAVMRSRLVLYEDAIENCGLFRTQKLLLSEIAGKMTVFTGCKTIILYPKPRNLRKMMVALVFIPDSTFNAWMSAVPVIDPAYLRSRWFR